MIKRALKLFGIVAIAAMIGFTFAGCRGPAGPEGERGEQGEPGEPGDQGPLAPAPELVISIDTDTDIPMSIGGRRTLVAQAAQDEAIVQILRWELYDAAYGEVIRLSRPSGADAGSASGSSAFSGNSAVITALSGGEARILVTAFGGGDAPVRSVITVTVESVAAQIIALRRGDLTQPATITTVIANEQIRPQSLYFDGEEVTITLTSGTPDDVLYLDRPGSMFTVGYGVTLILEDVTLRGRAGNTGGALISVADGGTLIMQTDSVIAGNINTVSAATVSAALEILDYFGGAVNVAPGGAFNMLAGTISGNTSMWGGGVFNRGATTIGGSTIPGGTITGNTGLNNGGGVVLFDGTVTMYSGAISANSVTAIASTGGGVFNEAGTFTMSGGTISGNTATAAGNTGGAGVLNASNFFMHGGAISGNTVSAQGGGVLNLNGGTFIMYDGTISGNTVTNTTALGIGGGVLNAGAGTTFVMHDGQIFGNIATQGGGVRIDAGAVFTMLDGEIFENNSRAMGAGVDNRNIFNMHGGSITDNTAAGTGTGGGVHTMGTAAVFNMHDGVISGNTASNGGGVHNSVGTFNIYNGVIYGNESAVATEYRNTAVLAAGFAALHNGFGVTSRYGVFGSDGFQPNGDLPATNLTIRVEDGIRLFPPIAGNLAEQLDWLRNFASDDGEYEIVLSGNETIAPQALPIGRTDLTIVLRGTVPSNINLSANGVLFTVGSGVTLQLDENITLVGRGPGGVAGSANNNNHMVRVDSGGTLIMNTGSRITGNTSTGTGINAGGGVRVNNGGVFILDNGEISGNATTGTANAGGVYVATGGRFDMLRGIISGNAAQNGGGVNVVSGGIFRIGGGTVYGNEATVSVDLRNTSRAGTSASLHNLGTTAHYGTFNGNGGFDQGGVLATTNATIRVVDGELQIPPMPPDAAERLEWLRSFAQSGGRYTIELDGDVPLAPQILPTGRSDLVITLAGDVPSNVNLSANGILFTIPSGVTFVLDNNVTLVGRSVGGNGNVNNNNHLVRVETGGVLIMNDGSMITGNTNANAGAAGIGGGGVGVNGGVFILNGGEISGNATTGTSPGVTAPPHGGGVHIATNGRFYMLRGAISDNTAQFGGGVFVAGGATLGTRGFFRMSGGTIYGVNAAEGLRNISRGAGTAFHNAVTGEVALEHAQHGRFLGTFDGTTVASLGNFEMVGTLAVADLTLSVTDGVLAVPPMAGGVADRLAWIRTFASNNETFTIELSDDEALAPQFLPSGVSGVVITLRGVGGMHTISLDANGVLFTIGSGVTLVLDENITLVGRGPGGVAGSANNNNHLVRIDGGTLYMNTGSRITGNTSTGAGINSGGGVRVNSGGVFILDNGEISGNATTGSANAGGVYIANGGRFDMRRGIISGNAAQNGGGVHVVSGGTFRISNGTIYGSGVDVQPEALRNTSRTPGSASLNSLGTSLRGTFANGDFTELGALTTTADTIEMVNGVAQ